MKSSFNPRTPHGVRPGFFCLIVCPVGFQSTHPTRGATTTVLMLGSTYLVSIHAPHTGCDKNKASLVSGYQFQSTHPTRGATARRNSSSVSFVFQSTHPTRGATCLDEFVTYERKFQSTHPTRGATSPLLTCRDGTHRFNPRTPHGVRQAFIVGVNQSNKFQSTHPTRGATAYSIKV